MQVNSLQGTIGYKLKNTKKLKNNEVPDGKTSYGENPSALLHQAKTFSH